MKIINNADINNLIVFCKKNLGIYKLVYKEQKHIYCLSLVAVMISAFLLIINIIFIFLHINIIVERICCFSCLLSCICALVLLRYIENKTRNRHLEIQDVRFRLLKKYYHDNHYSKKDILIINCQLKKRIEKIEKQKITILVVISVLVMSIWDIFVQVYFDRITFVKVARFFVFFVAFSFFVLIVVRFFRKTLYLYEENFYIKNNVSLIENLIYLNEYIIQEVEERNSNGRRRGRC